MLRTSTDAAVGLTFPHDSAAAMERSRRPPDNGVVDLPSYQEATKRPDWLELVALHVPIQEYARLCLVSKRFYHQFAPRLWNDPLVVAGMHRGDKGQSSDSPTPIVARAV